MGKSIRNYFFIISIFPLLALSAGCILPGGTDTPPTPTFTPTPTQTQAPTQTPSSTSTPAPTLTPTIQPTPEGKCAISWRWENDNLLITSVRMDKADGLQPNDRVITIDGRLALEVILEAEKTVDGNLTPEKRREQALFELLDKNILLVLFIQHHDESPYFYNLRPDCR